MGIMILAALVVGVLLAYFVLCWMDRLVLYLAYRWQIWKINKAEAKAKILKKLLDELLRKAYNAGGLNKTKKDCKILEFKRNEFVEKN